MLLVGHSYAGMVITGVALAVPERLSRLVYLDAYVPSKGQNEFDLWPKEERAAAEADVQAGHPFRMPVPPHELGITDPVMAKWVAARMTPQPLTTYEQPVDGTPVVPATYVHCTAGPVTSRFASRSAPFAKQARSRGWPVRELATGHDAMLTAPNELANLLLELGRQVEAGRPQQRQFRAKVLE